MLLHSHKDCAAQGSLQVLAALPLAASHSCHVAARSPPVILNMGRKRLHDRVAA
jgi:hypothetical protein